jgi:preprotein translocase subunit SecA
MILMNVQVRSPEDVEAMQQEFDASEVEYHHNDVEAAKATGDEAAIAAAQQEAAAEKARNDAIFSGIGRNDPCPCGSGKKFKHCHGAIA